VSAIKGRPTTLHDIQEWLRAMPAQERERVARLMADSSTVTAIRAERAAAIGELLNQPGATWQSVADSMGVSVAVISRMVRGANLCSRKRCHNPGVIVAGGLPYCAVEHVPDILRATVGQKPATATVPGCAMGCLLPCENWQSTIGCVTLADLGRV
jgi:uncharacterized protein YerC